MPTPTESPDPREEGCLSGLGPAGNVGGHRGEKLFSPSAFLLLPRSLIPSCPYSYRQWPTMQWPSSRPRAPCPPGRRALAGAGRPAHCSQPPRRCAVDLIMCALLVREVAPFVGWRDSGRGWGRGRGSSCCPARDLSAPGCGRVSDEAGKSRPGRRRRGRGAAARDPDQCRIVSCVAVPVIVTRFAI